MKQVKISPAVFAGTVIASLIVGALVWRSSAPYRGMGRRLLFSHKEDARYGPWSIGIYTGQSPFEITDPAEISNPVLTGKDVKDIDARFVADPFMVVEGGKLYLFFEAWNRTTSQGDIGYAESVDGTKWDYKRIIIDEPFHLSYPYVFQWNNEHYMIPESGHDLSVRLYKARSFPDKWEYLGNLLSGFRLVDSSILRYKDKWWLFVTSSPPGDALNVFYSDDLLNGWTPHPQNPVVKFSRHFSRSGGRVIIHDGHLYRFAQDDDPQYGMQVFAFEVTQLSEESYEEKLMEKPIVTMTGHGWNGMGMHNVDPHLVQGKWIAAVDGKDR